MKSIKKYALPFLLFILVFFQGCFSAGGETSTAALETAAPTVDSLPPRVTLESTHTPFPTATAMPTEVPPTPTLEVSGFQRMMRSMPTKEFVAGFYPDSVEIVYADSLITFVNHSFGYQTVLEPGIYFEKTLEWEEGYGYMNIYHPASDYTLTIYSGIINGSEKNSSQEMLEGSHGAQVDHAAQYGVFDLEEVELIELDGEQFAYSRIVVQAINGYLEFVALTGYRPHTTADQIVEFAMTGGFLRESVEEVDLQHEEVLKRMSAIVEEYKTLETNYVYQIQSNYSLYTGVCPTDTDASYGYSQENPIRMMDLSGDFLAQAFMGPHMASAYFETLLVNGQAVNYGRKGSISTGETILDTYVISAPGLESPVTLYVDQYSQDFYRVPIGFDCVGIMFPEQFIEE